MNFPSMLLRQKAAPMAVRQWPTLMRQKRSEPWKTNQNIRDTGHSEIRSTYFVPYAHSVLPKTSQSWSIVPSMLMRNLTRMSKTQAYLGKTGLRTILKSGPLATTSLSHKELCTGSEIGPKWGRVLFWNFFPCQVPPASQ